MKCDFLNPTDPNHCWHWTGNVIEWRLPEHNGGTFEQVTRAIREIKSGDYPVALEPPVAGRFCCHCGRRGLAIPYHLFDRNVHGPWLEMRRGKSAQYAKYVA